MSHRILFVDDEKPILRAIERLFFDSGYEVLTAESAEAGLALMAANPVDVVVSDVRMPGMDGHEFLRKIKVQYPETTRLILSGYADESAILNSIMDGSSNLYLLKPWDGQDFKKKVAQIFAARDLFTNKALLNFANRLDNLSSIPGIYNEVVRLTEQGADVARIAAVIETDPAVAAAVLRVVNNAFINVKTGSLTKAITFLGLTVIKTLVLSCILFNFAVIRGPQFSVKKLVSKANLANRMLAMIYAELLKKQLPDTQQTAALFNDIGLLMGMHYCPDQYASMLVEFTPGGEADFMQRERDALGMTHQEFGAYLLNLWGLPYPIVETALFHHQPLEDAVMNKELVAAAHIATHYAWQTISPDMAPGIVPGVFEALGVRENEVRRLLGN